MAISATTLKKAAKVVVAFIGFTLAYLNDHMDVVPVEYRQYVTVAIGLATLLGVYQAPHGALPSLTAVLPSRRRSAARKSGHHPSAKKVGTAHVPVKPAVVHPKATHPGAAVDHPAPSKRFPPKDAG